MFWRTLYHCNIWHFSTIWLVSRKKLIRSLWIAIFSSSSLDLHHIFVHLFVFDILQSFCSRKHQGKPKRRDWWWWHQAVDGGRLLTTEKYRRCKFGQESFTAGITSHGHREEMIRKREKLSGGSEKQSALELVAVFAFIVSQSINQSIYIAP